MGHGFFGSASPELAWQQVGESRAFAGPLAGAREQDEGRGAKKRGISAFSCVGGVFFVGDGPTLAAKSGEEAHRVPDFIPHAG